MKQISTIITISILLLTCNENKSKNTMLDAQKNDQIIIDTPKLEFSNEIKTKKEDTLNLYKIKDAPCIELQEFVIDIEKLNWVADINRLKNIGIYGELDRQKVEYFNNNPFYKITFENSKFNKAYNSKIHINHFDSLDFKLFEGVENIWGYFYRDKLASDLISDGVIEQWEFNSEQQADKALREILQPGFIIYFNTNPFFCRIRNKLIIFQSRAMAFSYDQKPIFEKFVKEKEAITIYKK